MCHGWAVASWTALLFFFFKVLFTLRLFCTLSDATTGKDTFDMQVESHFTIHSCRNFWHSQVARTELISAIGGRKACVWNFWVDKFHIIDWFNLKRRNLTSLLKLEPWYQQVSWCLLILFQLVFYSALAQSFVVMNEIDNVRCQWKKFVNVLSNN